MEKELKESLALDTRLKAMKATFQTRKDSIETELSQLIRDHEESENEILASGQFRSQVQIQTLTNNLERLSGLMDALNEANKQ